MHEVYAGTENVHYLSFLFKSRIVGNKRLLEFSYKYGIAEICDGLPAYRMFGLKNTFLEIDEAPRQLRFQRDKSEDKKKLDEFISNH